MNTAAALSNRVTAVEATDRMRRQLGNERGSTADFLLELARFDERRLWHELGYGAAFPYLRGELKLSKSAAYQRLVAARLIQRYPAIEAAVRSEDLCLSSIHELAKVLTSENAAEVLPRFFGVSAREAAEVAASLKPVLLIPVREVVTPVRPEPGAARAVHVLTEGSTVAPRAGTLGAPTQEPTGSVLTSEPAVTEGRQVVPPPRADAPRTAVLTSEPGGPIGVNPAFVLQVVAEPPRDVVQPLDATLSRLHLTVTRRFLEKLEAAKDRLGHACPGGTAAEVLEHCLDVALAEHAKRNGVVEKPRKEPRASGGRHVPAYVKREVIRRAGGWRCEWVLENGKRCGCSRRLQFDHIQPVALGGKSTVENVRLVCQAHNLLAARRTFGDSLIDRFAPGR
ncbi:MAG TPA: HNH endonuclease signature motif containing protein [Anaeromyxobacteraceae bacterium]|nr:HNH endonuclease signature motif containing protein [Anaeromyxobacteraceae bacterium]